MKQKVSCFLLVAMIVASISAPRAEAGIGSVTWKYAPGAAATVLGVPAGCLCGAFLGFGIATGLQRAFGNGEKMAKFSGDVIGCAAYTGLALARITWQPSMA